jgi:asparagine synthase (glutamine-hydrolysing)
MAKQYQNTQKSYTEFHLNTINTNVWEHVFETQDIDYGREGMEVRYPFMDKRLIDFCLRIPSNQKMQDGITRFILRNAMKGTIPDSIFYRYDKSILSPYYDYSFEINFFNMKKKILQSQSVLEDIVDFDYINSLEINNLTLNESIIFQHIYVLTIWLESKQF